VAQRKKSKFAHIKVTIAGFLTTDSLVRATAKVVYEAHYPNQQARRKAVMAYLHSLGVPTKLVFDDFSALFEAVFPADGGRGDGDVFPINLDYDQDNCKYTVLLDEAANLDNLEN
jgi:hypothetical protein